MTSTGKTFLPLILIVIAVAAGYLMSFDRGHNWGDDFAAYIDQARSIAEGNYNDLYAVNTFRFKHSTQKGIGPVFYPWGFPLLLSPVYYFFGLNIYAMKIYVSLFFLASLPVIYYLFRDSLSHSVSLLIVAIIGFSNWFLELKEHILSDVPFMFFSLCSIFLIQKFIIKKEMWLDKYVSYFLTGIFIAMSFNIRSIGISLLPVLLLTQFVEERRYSGNFFRTINRLNAIPYLSFLLFTAAVLFLLPRGGSGYISDLSITSLSNIIKNVTYYFALPVRFFPFMHFEIYYPSYYAFSKFSLFLYVFMLIFIIFGAAIRFKKDYHFIVYILINLAILLYWPHRQGFRFILHIFPFFLYFLFTGLSRVSVWMNISEKSGPLKLNLAVLFGVGLLFVSSVYFVHDIYKKNMAGKATITEGPFSADSREFFNYIKNNTGKDDAIIFFKPRALHLFTGRRSFTLNRKFLTPEAILDSPAQYMAVHKISYTPVDITTKDIPEKAQCEFENNSFVLCDLHPESHRQVLQN
jgi:hypothetical protein